MKLDHVALLAERAFLRGMVALLFLYTMLGDIHAHRRLLAASTLVFFIIYTYRCAEGYFDWRAAKRFRANWLGYHCGERVDMEESKSS